MLEDGLFLSAFLLTVQSTKKVTRLEKAVLMKQYLKVVEGA